MRDVKYTIYVTEKLLATEDLSDKKTVLKKHTDNINACDEDLLKLVDEVIADDQKGKIVDALDEKSQELKKHNQQLLEDVDQKINKMVTNLNEQVEEIKEQQLAITYKDLLALETE